MKKILKFVPARVRLCVVLGVLLLLPTINHADISVAYCIEDEAERYLAICVVSSTDTGTVKIHDRQTQTVLADTQATFGRDGNMVFIVSATNGQTFAVNGKWDGNGQGVGEVIYTEFAPSQSLSESKIA